jgi:hypothetical protein
MKKGDEKAGYGVNYNKNPKELDLARLVVLKKGIVID